MNIFRNPWTKGAVTALALTSAPGPMSSASEHFNFAASNTSHSEQNYTLNLTGQNPRVLALNNNTTNGFSVRFNIGAEIGAQYNISIPKDIAGVPQRFSPYFKENIDGSLNFNASLCSETQLRYTEGPFYVGAGLRGCLRKGDLTVNTQDAIRRGVVIEEANNEYDQKLRKGISDAIKKAAPSITDEVTLSFSEATHGMIPDKIVTDFINDIALPAFTRNISDTLIRGGTLEQAVEDTFNGLNNTPGLSELPPSLRPVVLGSLKNEADNFATSFGAEIPPRPNIDSIFTNFGGDRFNQQSFEVNAISGGVFAVVGVQGEVYQSDPYAISVFAEGRAGYGGTYVTPNDQDNFGFYGVEASARAGLRAETSGGAFLEVYGEVPFPIEQSGPGGIRAERQTSVTVGILGGIQF